MRNLKKLAALALAVIMVFALMATASAAGYADITDKADVKNVEAVSLLVDLGIIDGIKQSDGTIAYKPADIVDRATMAKLITYIKAGDVEPSLFEGTTTDLTDIDTSWAEGYIKYCYSTGIISGDGAGHFFPTTTVNVVAAAKMLLVSLGYNAVDRGYEADVNWSVNVMKDAQSAGLVDGMSVKATDGLTRDNAARMIYNALFANTVTLEYAYDMGNKYVSKVVKSTTTLGEETYDGLQKVSAVVYAYGDDTKLAQSSDYYTSANHGTKANITAGVKQDLASVEDNLGKMVNFYVEYDGDIVSTAVANNSKNEVYTVKSGLTAGGTKTTKDSVVKWLNDNSIELSGKETDVTIVNYSDDATATIVSTEADAGLAMIGNATIAYVVDWTGDGTIDALVKTTKAVAKVTSAVKTKTDTNGDLTVYVPGVTTGYVDCVGYEGVAKNDYVMYIEHDGTTYVTECEKITGVLSGYSGSSKVGIDGTYYTISSIGLMSRRDVLAVDSTYKKDVNFWLDSNGNVVFAKLVDGTAEVSVAVVLGYDTSSSSVDDTSVGEARLLFTDGTTKVVTVASVAGTMPEFESTLNSGEGTGTPHQTYGDNYAMAIYEINDDGEYELTIVGDDSVEGADETDYMSGELTNDKIESGKAVFSDGFKGDSKTIFAVAKYNSDNGKFTGVTLYKGIAKAPEFAEGSNGADGAVISADGVASFVFIVNGDVTDSGDDAQYVFIEMAPSASYASSTKTWTVPAWVGDEETTVEIKNDAWTGDGVATAVGSSAMLYKATLNDDGVIYKLEDATSASLYKATGTGVKFANDVLQINTATGETIGYYTLASDAEIYVVNVDKDSVTKVDGADIVTDKTDVVYIYATTSHFEDLIADTIYIFETESSETEPVVKLDDVLQTITWNTDKEGTLTGDITKVTVSAPDEGVVATSTEDGVITITVTPENGTEKVVYTLTVNAND